MKKIKAVILMIGLGWACVALSGCNVGPTYGTGKSAGQQLMDDVSSIASLRPNTSNVPVKTNPRPELVPPVTREPSQLPAPQISVANADSRQWPESPEERRQRLRDEATINQDNPNYVSPIQPAQATYKRERPTDLNREGNERIKVTTLTQSREQRSLYQKKRQENKVGSPTQRKYLSEPPLVYRQPAQSAPIDEPGDDEATKERRRKKVGESKGKKRWWPF